ncbi:MAG: hypothetical protein R3E53_05150 [Myxococcota bacterium]
MTRRLRRLASGRLRIELHGGLDLGLPGAAGAPIESAGPLRSVALLGHDHPRARCSLRVQVGERVARGQTLFVDRRRPEIRFASPAAGLVRVARREQVHEPVVVEVEVDEADDLDVGPTFDPLDLERTRALGREGVIRRLLEAGEWPALRTRPFGDLADPDVIPDALFVRAMDSHPGAPRAVDVMADRAEDFRSGVAALAGLIEGPVYVCCDLRRGARRRGPRARAGRRVRGCASRRSRRHPRPAPLPARRGKTRLVHGPSRGARDRAALP